MIRIWRNVSTGCVTVLVAALLAAGCSTTETNSSQDGSNATELPDEANFVARVDSDEQADAKDKGDELICRRARPTGSRISERICMTADDWEMTRQRSQEMLERTTRKAQQFEDN